VKQKDVTTHEQLSACSSKTAADCGGKSQLISDSQVATLEKPSHLPHAEMLPQMQPLQVFEQPQLAFPSSQLGKIFAHPIAVKCYAVH